MIAPELLQKVEEPVRPLVKLLNDIPNTQTVMSCGGHWGFEGGCHLQAENNRWWVLVETKNKKLLSFFAERDVPSDMMSDGRRIWWIFGHKIHMQEAMDTFGPFVEGVPA